MRISVPLLSLAILFSCRLFADTWEGNLIDASCYHQEKSVSACYPTNSTVSYALVIERRIFKLDEAVQGLEDLWPQKNTDQRR